jgi:hypothetical protein
LLEPALMAARPTVKSSIFGSTIGETLVKSTQVCFPHIQLYTRIFACLSVDLPSCGSFNKFTDASFFTNTSKHLKMSQRTSLTKSCIYLKSGSSLQ